jgi:hypothetical protein
VTDNGGSRNSKWIYLTVKELAAVRATP